MKDKLHPDRFMLSWAKMIPTLKYVMELLISNISFHVGKLQTNQSWLEVEDRCHQAVCSAKSPIPPTSQRCIQLSTERRR